MSLVRFGAVFPLFDAGLVVFDKDGTLLDFTATWRPKFLAAVERLLPGLATAAGLRAALYDALGYDPASGSFHLYAPSRPEVARHFTPFATAPSQAITATVTTVLYQHSRPHLSWDACEQRVQQEFVPALADTHDLVPTTDLAQLFSTLYAAGVALAVITSDDRGPTEATLTQFNIRQFIDFIACGDDAYRHKPDPEALLAASEQLGVPLERTAMIGDSVMDLQMGAAAAVGLRVGVLTGCGRQEELKPAAHVVLSSIAEIRVVPSPGPGHWSGRPGP